MKCLKCGKETGSEGYFCVECLELATGEDTKDLNATFRKKKTSSALLAVVLLFLLWSASVFMFYLFKGNNDFFNVSYINIEDDWLADPIAFDDVIASSTLNDNSGKYYDVSLIVDRNEKTTWFEGVEGEGIGEHIVFSSEKVKYLHRMDIINGCCNPYTLFYCNSRMKKCSVEFDGGVKFEVDFRDEYDKKTVVKFDQPICTKSVKITILETYSGTECEDTAISEIAFV